MLKKTFIQLIKTGEKIPVDLHGLRTGEIEHTDLFGEPGTTPLG
jgi:hypothetical protein